MNKRFRLNIFTKTFIITMVLSIIPMLVVTIIGLKYFSQNVNDEKRDSLHSSVIEKNLLLQTKIADIKTLALSFADNQDAIDMLTIISDGVTPENNSQLKVLEKRVSNYLSKQMKIANGNFENLFFMNMEGVIVADGIDGVSIGDNNIEMEHFKIAKDGKQGLCDLIVSPVNGRTVLITGTPVFNGTRQVGTFSLPLDFLIFTKDIVAYDESTQQTYGIFDKNGLLINNTNEELIGKTELSKGTDYNKWFLNKLKTEKSGVTDYIETDNKYFSGFDTFAEKEWYIYGLAPEKVFLAPINTYKQIILVFLIISSILAFIATILFSRSISKPIRDITKVTGLVADGNLDVKLDYKFNNEIGDLSHSLEQTVETLSNYKSYINEITDILNQMAAGDMTIHTKLQYIGEFAAIEKAMNKISNSLNETLMQISQVSEQVASGSEKVSFGASTLSIGASEQTYEIKKLSELIAMISEQIRKNAENSKKADEMSNRAEVAVISSNSLMQKLMVAINDISTSSVEIKKIIEAIEDIAFQTNILALNANIESARAGEAGKGFSVVANEVGNLAAKSAESIKNTTLLIEQSLVSVERGVKLADETAKELLGIVEETKTTTSLINGVTVASNEQAIFVSQITQGIEQISAVVQTNASTAQESSQASEELSQQAKLMKSLVSKFKLK